MKKILFLLTVPLTLASCSTLGIPNADVSGNINGIQPSGKIRLAFQGMTVTGYQAPVADQINIPTFNPEKRAYAVSLPESPANGAYELLAYVDANGNNRYDSADNEVRTGSTGKAFIYSKEGTGSKSGTDLMNLKPGWTLYSLNEVKVEKSGAPFTNYILNW